MRARRSMNRARVHNGLHYTLKTRCGQNKEKFVSAVRGQLCGANILQDMDAAFDQL